MAGDWDFAEQSVVGTLLKAAPRTITGQIDYITNPWSPAYPALPWGYEYAYPTLALKVRSVLVQPVLIPNPDPRWHRFEIDDDPGVTPSKVILTNVHNAIIVFAAQVTNPAYWDADFIEDLAAELGRRLAPSLMGVDATKLAASDVAAEDQLAMDKAQS